MAITALSLASHLPPHHIMRATAMPLLLLLLLLSLSLSPSNANNSGRWEILNQSIGISAMHMSLLPNNKVIIFDRTDFGCSNISLPSGRCRNDSRDQALPLDCTAHSVEFDPSTNSARPLTILTDTWCSSGALSPNGTLIQTGGFNDGDHAVRYISACQGCDWTEDQNGLTVRRWYSTDQLLPDGTIIVVGGRDHFSYEFIPKASSSSSSSTVFELRFLRETKSPWEKKENNLYPFVFLIPDGNLFIFANNRSILLDFINHDVIRTFPDLPGGVSRNYPSTGSSALLPIRLDTEKIRAEVMVCGGTLPEANMAAEEGVFLAASAACGRMVVTDESPEWVMEEMPIGRTMGDMVLLPTGDVLIVNGAMKGSAGWCMGREPALSPVLYRTGVVISDVNRSFEVLAPARIPRMYHSSAILLPDGRVMVGGSNPNRRYEFTGVLYPTELSLEAFSPPYLEMGGRPEVREVEEEVGYGERMRLEFVGREGMDGDVGVVSVTMVAPTFSTHSFGMNQRVLVLKVERVRRREDGECWAAEVVAPATAEVAPPGYYLVFVVHGGVPSEGRWVRIK